MDLKQTLAEDQMEVVDDCSQEEEHQQQSSDSASAVACRPKTKTTNSSDGDKREIIFVPAPGIKRSQVWQYFGFYKYKGGDDVVKKDYTCCKICKELIPYHTTSNTTNMTTHLARLHSIKIEPVASSKRKAEEMSDVSQPKMTAMFKIKENSPLYTNITESLTKYICMDFQPLSTVESRWFQEYTRALNNRYSLPTRKKLTKELIPKLYEKVKLDIKATLSGLSTQCCALTTDGWTSTRSNPPVNYETITCHFIDAAWEVKTVNLETKPLGGASNAENLKANINKVMREWAIQPSGITTDNASNITKAMKLLNDDDELLQYGESEDLELELAADDEQLIHLSIDHIKCFAHTLNLAAQKALSVSSDSLANVRKVVKYFRKSALAGEL